ncbi:metallopeptidase [Nocardia tengchongensis]|uniref:Metallopeptidase n=1 Tax=Nocardia tengchongensis TaxID=2055889 RepID=A0ABX8CZ95_9NOCA|nr:metallopeptidase [Nocardia tengchongensis]QVI24578.1 metallopeptidase [Nocardia tengchongensis]
MGVLAVAVALLSGCTRNVHGHAVSIYDDPFKVAGLPTTSGPSGPRTGVPDSTLTAQNSDGGMIDKLVLNALDDIQTYWQGEFPREFGGDFTPVGKFISWNAKTPRSQAGQFCGETSYRLVNAAYCRLDGSVGWDRGVLLPAVADEFGKMSVVMVLAHEYGHAIQEMAKLVGRRTPTIVKEQQADCFAGAFIRNVAEGKAPHFTINTSDGLNAVLAATVAFRDADPDDPQSVHGSAFERVTAVQIGFTDGPKSCKAIDQNEIDRRRGNLPQTLGNDANHGQSEVTQSSLQDLAKAMASIMPISDEPEYGYDTAKLNCRNGADTAPVTYCPATNRIGTDVSALHDRGVSNADDQDALPANVTGDFTAYIVFISRYTLAVQHSEKLPLKGAKTGLRAACLSGVISGKLADPSRKASGGITLSAGDLDEAVSGLLTDGLAASDTDGKTVPSGFSRVDAFRAGVLGTQDICYSRYT